MSWTTDPGDSPAGDVEPAVPRRAGFRRAPCGRRRRRDRGFGRSRVERAVVEDGSETDADSVDAAEAGDATGADGAEAGHAPDGDEAQVEAEAEAEADAPEVVEPTREPDELLLAAHDVALAALREVTPEATVGAAAGYTLEDGGVVSLLFENRMAGYPGWFWTVSLARVDDGEPSVLELELLPGDDALLAPEWVPWAVRLADYQAAQVALREAGEVDGGEEDLDDSDEDGLDLDDLDDLDAADFDRDGSPILHAGDVDGVDIDELAEASDDTDDDFDDDSGEDESDVDDSDFVDDADEDDLDEDEDDSDVDDEADSDEDESDNDFEDESDDEEDSYDEDDSDEDDSDQVESEDDSDDDDSDDDSGDEDEAVHGFRFDSERDQN